jgi:hypothetical protein
MVNRIETSPSRTHAAWESDLDERRELRDSDVDNLPLKLTQERIRAESERIGDTELNRAPLPSSRVAPSSPSEPAPLREPAAPQSATPQTAAAASPKPVQASRPGSILGLEAPLVRTPQPAAATPAVSPAVQRTTLQGRRPSRTSRALRGAVVILVLALTAETVYGYLAIRRDSVNVFALPGAATVRTLDADTAGARSKTSAAIETAYSGARRLAGEARDHYHRWRSR